MASKLFGGVCESFGNKSESVSQILLKTEASALYFLTKVLGFIPCCRQNRQREPTES